MKISKYVQLHFIILLWGFTPVLGKLISIDAYDLVWYRLLFSALSLYLYLRYKGLSLSISKKDLVIILATGLVVGLHWFCFYHAIKISNVSVTMAGFSSITLFGSLFQPLLLKKKFYWTDVFYGIAISVGLIVILNFESIYFWGIVFGVIAAITAAFFGIYNGKLILKNNEVVITFYEFVGAFLFISVLKFFNHSDSYIPALGMLDFIWLLVLSIACTTLAFTMSVDILKYFTPLTVIITNNLEPIYGIVFSIIIFGSSEYMSLGFYIGTAIILASVFTYPFISAKLKK